VRNRWAVRLALAVAALSLPLAASATTWLRPLFLKRLTYGESFTFLADLDDGSYLHLQLSLTNLGPGPTKGICRALLVPPRGAPWKAASRVSRDAVSWVGGPEEKLVVGACSAWAGPTSGIEVHLEGATFRLAYASRLRPVGPHEAPLAVGEERYQTEVLLYRAPLTASLALPGQPPRDVPGMGYLDHTRTTVSPKDLAKRWIRFRGLRGERGLLLLGREGKDGRFTPLWACADPSSCRTYGSFRLVREGKGDSTAFRVEVRDGGETILLRSGRLLYRDAPIEEMGVLGKLVGPFTGSPVTYVYRATAATGGGAPVSGVLEVELADE
jgi:hypothetical protein